MTSACFPRNAPNLGLTVLRGASYVTVNRVQGLLAVTLGLARLLQVLHTAGPRRPPRALFMGLSCCTVPC